MNGRLRSAGLLLINAFAPRASTPGLIEALDKCQPESCTWSKRADKQSGVYPGFSARSVASGICRFDPSIKLLITSVCCDPAEVKDDNPHLRRSPRATNSSNDGLFAVFRPCLCAELKVSI